MTLLKNFRSIIRPELIEMISKFKDNDKWQDKVSIMKLIALVLQDEFYAQSANFESSEVQKNAEGGDVDMTGRRESEDGPDGHKNKSLKIDDYINASTVIQYFAKKLNNYLKDETYIVRKNAMDILEQLQNSASQTHNPSLMLANQKFVANF